MKPRVLVGLAALAVATGCRGPRSAAGFRLPDGDPQRGQLAFVELKCHTCHQVAGVDLPAPVADAPVPVRLGGEIIAVKTDGELVTSIVHPSYRLAPGYPKDLIRKGEASRMPDYGREMTVQQMVDLVAFLQSRYRVARVEPEYK
jgi:hypothetical protein